MDKVQMLHSCMICAHVHHTCIMLIMAFEVQMISVTCDIAGPQLDGPCTPQFCAPRGTPHMCDPVAPPLTGPQDDVRGLGVTFHQLMTSVDLAWEPISGPYAAEDGMHIMSLQEEQGKKAVQTALTCKHSIWVSCMQSKLRGASLS